MADKLDLIYDMVKEVRTDVSGMKDDISEMKIVQAEQAIILEKHQNVSETNRAVIQKVTDEIIPKIKDKCLERKESLEEKFTPKPIDWKKTISWGVVVVSGIVGIVAKVMGWF